MDWQKYIFNNSVTDNDGCWIWQKSKDKHGYGHCITNHPTRLNESAHRVSYRAYNGEIVFGDTVSHTCTNNDCVNPEHLFIEHMIPQQKNNNKSGYIHTPLGQFNSISEAASQHNISTSTLYARFKSDEEYFKTER